MKTVEVNKQNAEYFYGLDPFSYLEGEMSDTVFIIGTVKEQDTYDEATGLLICESLPDALAIRWLFVAPGERGQGYGDALLSAAFDAASSLGKDRVAAMLGSEPEREKICPRQREYFEYNGFTREGTAGDYEEPMLICDKLDWT